ncbi:MAG: hypothetical protein U0U33_17160 [Chitinophagaceae bacterium]
MPFFFGWMIFVIFLSIAMTHGQKVRVYLFYSLYVASYCMFFIGDGNFDVSLLSALVFYVYHFPQQFYALCACMLPFS